MGNRRLLPTVYKLDDGQLAQYALDNYGLQLSPAELGREEMISAIQDAKAAIPEGQDFADASKESPPAAPTSSAPPPELARAPNIPFGNEPTQGPPDMRTEQPQPRQLEPGRVVPQNERNEPERDGFVVGGPSKPPVADNDPPIPRFAQQRQQLDIPEGYTLPDFNDDGVPVEPIDPTQANLDALRNRIDPNTAKQGPAQNIFRHPDGTRWLFNPLTRVYWKPTETLMQNKHLVPIIQGDPPPGSAIGTA